MKIIFLDIDGVLNFSGCRDKINGIFFINDKKIKILKRIINQTNAKVVLSSTWKTGWWDIEDGIESIQADNFMALCDKLSEFNIELYDKTRDLNTSRGEEIKDWLSERNDIDNILIIDDKADVYPYNDFLLKTTFRDGLKKEQINEAIQMLKSNKYKKII